jgi:hypothetical protein
MQEENKGIWMGNLPGKTGKSVFYHGIKELVFSGILFSRI